MEDTFDDQTKEKKHNAANSSGNNDNKPRIRPKCQFCQSFGHTQEVCRKFAASQSSSQQNNLPRGNVSQNATSATGISCYCCGAPRYIRSQCPTCKHKPPASNSNTTHTSSFDILHTDICTVSVMSRPLLEVSVAGKHSLVYVDSGAKNKIAGHFLFKHLCELNLHYLET
ncbi:unnamed protein product [Ceutorhynchus assimilis]|uniref:Uncharacterized protein n=1 Tax=Ceutorhynchus assimilis TaxID=467358 RepID=A0A9N9MGR8_9CUCU|nr:unnamed protein product [Ceutorhynchus assimilis]